MWGPPRYTNTKKHFFLLRFSDLESDVYQNIIVESRYSGLFCLPKNFHYLEEIYHIKEFYFYNEFVIYKYIFEHWNKEIHLIS